MDNKQELISVIVPVYNDEQYLPRCLDSLIAQSYNNIEIIVIDDGSQDKSGNICDDYANKDNRINVIHQDYLGVSGARNTGLKNVTGKYIAFLDGDDEADTEYIGKLYETLLNNDLDIAQCSLIRIRDGKRINELPCENIVRIYTGMDMQMKIFNRDRYFTMCLCGKLFKTELFDGMSFPLGRINEDESLIYLLMYRAKRVGVIDDYLYYYHYNQRSITEKKYNIHRLDAFYMLEEKYVFYRSKGLDKFADKTANEYFSQMSVVFTHNNDEISDYKTIARKAIDLYKKDRKDILEKSNLSTFRWIFMKLSYVSIGFIALYGKMLKLYFNIKNYRKSKER